MNLVPIRRALISVSDKSGLSLLAAALVKWKVEIISTGGTGQELNKLQIPWRPIEEFTGNPEAFQGRMKTISFQVASSLLFRRQDATDCEQAEELGILPIDLVICNLYPFTQVALQEAASENALVENIDIGGPTMLRAAAKNFSAVTVLGRVENYPGLLGQLETYQGQTDRGYRQQMALETFQLLAAYDSAIANTLEQRWAHLAPAPTIHFQASSAMKLRYGENPHQRAWAYPHWSAGSSDLLRMAPLQGKELSFNNLLDADAALQLAWDLDEWCPQKTAVVIVKHLNPCGAACGKSPVTALAAAWAGDPISSFGSIISCTSEVDAEFASFLQDKFVELIIAPSFSEGALNLFAKKKNLRLLAVSLHASRSTSRLAFSLRSVNGGLLVQEEDRHFSGELASVTSKHFSPSQLTLAAFGIRVAKHLRSNAIVLVQELAEEGWSILGAGMGNPNRLVSLQQAVEKAQENSPEQIPQAVLVSDAFFPFADNIELAHRHNIQYIVQPGGSIKDDEVIAACEQHQMAMVFTQQRHFRH